MKKDAELTPQERQEKAWTQKRIHYHNVQAKGVTEWKEQAQNVLTQKMDECKLVQIFEPLHLNEATAFEILFEQAKLNKIHSMYCDLYEELPFRPDMAFDVVWRSFEVMSKYYSGEVWNDKSISDPDMFRRVSKEVVLPVIKTDHQIEKAFDQLVEAIPDSTLRFMVVRLYFKRELGITPQLGLIKQRAVEILSEGLYNDFKQAFISSDNNLTPEGHRSAVRRMRSIIIGEPVELYGNSYKPLAIEDRIELLMSCVLYVSRCERYHGDYMSQFKSSLAKQATYHNFYFLLIITDLLFWIVMYKFMEHENIPTLFGLDKLAECSEKRRMNLESVFA